MPSARLTPVTADALMAIEHASDDAPTMHYGIPRTETSAFLDAYCGEPMTYCTPKLGLVTCPECLDKIRSDIPAEGPEDTGPEYNLDNDFSI